MKLYPVLKENKYISVGAYCFFFSREYTVQTHVLATNEYHWCDLGTLNFPLKSSKVHWLQVLATGFCQQNNGFWLPKIRAISLKRHCTKHK